MYLLQTITYSMEFVTILLASNTILLGVVGFFLTWYIKTISSELKSLREEISDVYAHINRHFVIKELCDERSKRYSKGDNE
jgi:hypothetical protein